jgi:hypothetical protein
MSGGATNNVIEYHFDKIAPRTYEVEIPTLALANTDFSRLAPLRVRIWAHAGRSTRFESSSKGRGRN